MTEEVRQPLTPSKQSPAISVLSPGAASSSISRPLTRSNKLAPGVHLSFPADDGSWRAECTRDELVALDELRRYLAPYSHYDSYPDKYLMVFLLARKLNIERTFNLLETNLQWRIEHNYTTPVAFHTLNMELVRRAWAFTTPGARDKQGRGILYLIGRSFEPRRYKPEEQRALLVWLWEYTYNESMDYHRNGMVIVEDLRDSSIFRNFSVASLQELIGIYHDHFPGRIKQVFLVSPSLPIKLIVNIVRCFVKSKLVQRVLMVETPDRLGYYVEQAHLVEAFGGSLEYDHVQWMDRMMRASAIAASSSVLQQRAAAASLRAMAVKEINDDNAASAAASTSSAVQLATFSHSTTPGTAVL